MLGMEDGPATTGTPGTGLTLAPWGAPMARHPVVVLATTATLAARMAMLDLAAW